MTESEAVAGLVDDEAAIVELNRDRAATASTPRFEALIRLTGAAENGLDLFQGHAGLNAVAVLERHVVGTAANGKGQHRNEQETQAVHGGPRLLRVQGRTAGMRFYPTSGQLLDHARDELGELLASLGCIRENLGDFGRLQVIGQAEIGDDGEAEHLHASVNSDQHFGNR